MRPIITLAVIGLSAALAPRLPADETSPAEKAAAEWLYPDAKVVSAGNGGMVSCVVQETADDVPKVLKHEPDLVLVGAGADVDAVVPQVEQVEPPWWILARTDRVLRTSVAARRDPHVAQGS